MQLKDRAMTVNFSASQWAGKALDRDATAKVVADNHTDNDAAEVHKWLVPKPAIFPVQQAVTAARNEHYKWTLPWRDGGDRILTSTAFFDYRSAMDTRKQAFWNAYQVFEGLYPDLVKDAPRRLNGLFQLSDFPPVGDLRRRFGFSVQFAPLADASDFRVQLGDEIEAEVRSNIEQTMQDAVGGAQRKLWERLYKTAQHFTTTLADVDQKFHDTTVENLREIAKLAPKLTLVPDPNIDAISQQILDMLKDLTGGKYSAALQKDPKERAHTTKQAKRTLADIERIMQGAF